MAVMGKSKKNYVENGISGSRTEKIGFVAVFGKIRALGQIILRLYRFGTAFFLTE